MEEQYINLTLDNLATQHVCCAISDKKHQEGVKGKKQWLQERIKEGHVFRKLEVNAKVFIEYAPLENAWVPVTGKNYLYIYCLWVAGSYKGKGHAKNLLTYCIQDAKQQGKSGICVISSKKKKPYLSDKKFMKQFQFEVVDSIGEDYELLALSFDGTVPQFTQSVKKQEIDSKDLTIYYSKQCPYISNCIHEVEKYCKEKAVMANLIEITSAKQAKEIPCVFNNWATFYHGKFLSNTLLNVNMLEKLLQENKDE